MTNEGVQSPGDLQALNFNSKSLKNFDWRALKKYFSPQATADLNRFLEQMPQNGGQTILIIAAVVWGVAGLVGLYTSIQVKELTKMRAELQSGEAMKPTVPMINEQSIDSNELAAFVNKIKPVYTGLDIGASGSSVTITAKETFRFGQFREAIGHVQNGGSGWRVNMDSLCVGRECKQNNLAATLKINKVTVDRPG